MTMCCVLQRILYLNMELMGVMMTSSLPDNIKNNREDRNTQGKKFNICFKLNKKYTTTKKKLCAFRHAHVLLYFQLEKHFLIFLFSFLFIAYPLTLFPTALLIL